jgi:hypothetical protein
VSVPGLNSPSKHVEHRSALKLVFAQPPKMKIDENELSSSFSSLSFSAHVTYADHHGSAVVYTADDVKAIIELGEVDRDRLMLRLRDPAKLKHKGLHQWQQIVECYKKKKTVGHATYHQ